MSNITNHRDLIMQLGGPPRVAEALAIESINVRQWKARNRIPPEWWAPLIAVADRPGIDAEWFLRSMPERKRADTSAGAGV